MNPNEIGSIWKYREKLYVITGYTMFKHPTNRKWLRAYTYEPMEKNIYNIYSYTREMNEFMDRFERVITDRELGNVDNTSKN